MLFHDVQARLQDFGAWKFWEELTGKHETFTFNHGFGLGVLRKPGGNRDNDPELVNLLFPAQPAPEASASLRAFYVHASKHMENTHKVKRLRKLEEEKARLKEKEKKPAQPKVKK